MKLNVLERIMALGILGIYKEGNIITLRVLAGLKPKLALTEEEVEKWNVRTEEDNYKWSPEGNEGVEIELTESEIKLIKEQLVKMDKEQKLTFNHFSLYEKFVENKT